MVLLLIHFTAAIASVLNRKFHVHVYYKTNYSDFCLHVSLHKKCTYTHERCMHTYMCIHILYIMMCIYILYTCITHIIFQYLYQIHAAYSAYVNT